MSTSPIECESYSSGAGNRLNWNILVRRGREINVPSESEGEIPLVAVSETGRAQTLFAEQVN